IEEALGKPLANDTTYTLLVRVTAKDKTAAVRAELNGTKVVDWSGPVTDLTPSRNWFTPDPGQLGLGVWDHCQFHLKAVEFRPLSGTAEWKPGKSAPPAVGKPGQVRRFGRYKGAVIQIALSPDGRHVFAGEDGVSKWA